MVTYLDRVAISKLAPDIMGTHLVRFHHRDRRGVQLRHDAARAFLFGMGWRVAVRRASFSRWIPRRTEARFGHFRRGASGGGLTPSRSWRSSHASLAADFRVFGGVGFAESSLKPTPVSPARRLEQVDEINEIPRIDGTLLRLND
jgi:hypothetical protein